MGRIVSQTDLTEILEVHQSTIRDWQNAGMPFRKGTGRKNAYDTAEVVRWLINRQKIDGEVIDLHAEKARLTKAQADKAEMEAAEKQGELVNRDEVIAHGQMVLQSLKQRLLALPARLSPKLVAEADLMRTKNILEEAIARALREIRSDFIRDPA